MYANGCGMGWMWFIWPAMILAIVLVVVLLVRGSAGGTSRGNAGAPPPGPGTGRTRAQEILDERYARGELTDKEYQNCLGQLRGDTG